MMDDLETLIDAYPDYQVVTVGHSLGGAVAALAGIELTLRGWKPHVTTFGEPRIGNQELAAYIDELFDLTSQGDDRYGPVGRRGSGPTFHRVTHRDDPVPLLPPAEWGYLSHAGEIYLSNKKLPVEIGDLRSCDGDADTNCSAGAEASPEEIASYAVLASSNEKVPPSSDREPGTDIVQADAASAQDQLPLTFTTCIVPARYRLWQLFFAHRDYFHRLGMCLPSPTDLWPPVLRLVQDRMSWFWLRLRFRW